MDTAIFQAMQSAVEAAQKSPHETSKVGAALLLEDGHVISAHNFWPEAIETAIGRETKIGNSSGTIHAETAVIIAAMRQNAVCEGARLFITDPPCPNCAKNIAEAGITHLYIDHKGFDKDFAARRMRDFQALSLAIFAHAGIGVSTVFRKEQRTETMLHDSPPLIPTEEPQDWPYAACTATDKNGNTRDITARAHPSIGFSIIEPELEGAKYSYVLQPFNRLLMLCARQGLQIDGDTLRTSRCPSARELVNMIGAGITHIAIADMKKARDIYGPQALKQLSDAGIISYTSISKR